MKLYQLFQAFDFEEVFPAVTEMFPNAGLHRDVFEKAYGMLCSIKPILSKKSIIYELKEDPNSKTDMIVGADDACFDTTWDVCLGKEVRKGRGTDIDDTTMVANCLLNVLFLGRHPQHFERDYRKLMK